MKKQEEARIPSQFALKVLNECRKDIPSISSLVERITSETGTNKDRVVSAIIELQEKGLATLGEKNGHQDFKSYMLSPLSLWYWEGCGLVVFSLVMTAVTSGIWVYLRYILGGLLVLYLPGYSLIGFLYYKKKDLDELTRVALSLGLSLAIVSLIGLALNYTPAGLTLTQIAASLALFVLIMITLTLWRKYSLYRFEIAQKELL